nr:mucin-2-like [Lytechinus pictus]
MQHHTFGIVVLIKSLIFLLITIHANGVAGQTCPSDCQCYDFRLTCVPALLDGRIPDWIPGTTTVLTLLSHDITNISASDLGGLPNLMELNIISRNIEYIEPGAFAPLPNLTSLGIYRAGAITAIDESLLLGIPQLEFLRVEGTSADHVTEGAIAILPNLRRLNLISNRFRSLPNNFLSGSNITHLDMSTNSMSDISTDAFKDLSSLVDLSLADNVISVISGDIFQHLSSLEVLNMESNRIRFVNSSTFDALGGLRVLNLANNVIDFLPSDTFQNLTNLTELNLASNSLSFLPRRLFGELLDLLVLNLGGNSLTTLYRAVFNFEKDMDLVRIDLTGNPLHCDCHVKWLRSTLETNTITCASPVALANTQLSVLNATDFECTHMGSLGSSVLLVCPAESNPDWQISWELPGGIFLPPDTANEVHQVTSDGDLLILSASLADVGEYICDVLDGRNIVATETISLELSVPPEITTPRSQSTESRSSTSRSNSTPMTTSDAAGTSTLSSQSNSYDADIVPGTLGHIISNNQYPESYNYIWITPGGLRIQKNESVDRFTVLTDGSLEINLVIESDAGIYRFSVIDLNNTVVTSTVVRVSLRQDVRTTIQSQTESYEVVIVLGGIGSILPNIQFPQDYNFIWITPGGIRIQKNESIDRFSVSTDGTLVINRVIMSDEGIYRLSVIDLSNIVVTSVIVRVRFPTSMTTLASTEFSTDAKSTATPQSNQPSSPGTLTAESIIPSRLSTNAPSTSAPTQSRTFTTNASTTMSSQSSLSPSTSTKGSTVPPQRSSPPSSQPVTGQIFSSADPSGIILVDRNGAVLISPKPASQVDVIFQWVTPDGQILFLNDTSDPYSVSSDGDLQIKPVGDMNVGTYVVFVTDMSGLELDFKVFRIQISSESTTISERSTRVVSSEGPSRTSFTASVTPREGTTTADSIFSSRRTTLDPFLSTESDVVDRDSFTVSITSLESVVLSPEYPNSQDLVVIWVTPDGTRVTKNQTIFPFNVSNDGFLKVEPITESLVGVYTVVITDNGGIVLDVNVIRVVFMLPTTKPTVKITTLQTTVVVTTSAEATTTIPIEEKTTSNESEQDTTTVTTTKIVTDRDDFTVILYSRNQTILSPRYPFDIEVNIIWVTPDGERLAENDTAGPYEVRSDGHLLIEPVEDTSLGVYTATITTLDNTLIDLNIIRVELMTPSTGSPELTTTDTTNTTTSVETMSTDFTSVISNYTNTVGSSQPTESSESNNNPSSSPMRTSDAPDEDFFVVILTQIGQAVLPPHYIITNSSDVIWITPDGITLEKDESIGPYNVTDDGRLIIQPVKDENLGTYTVSIIDADGYLRDLNVIRVQYSEPTMPVSSTESTSESRTPITSDLSTLSGTSDSVTQTQMSASHTPTRIVTSDSPIPSSNANLFSDSTIIRTTSNPAITDDNFTTRETSTYFSTMSSTGTKRTTQNVPATTSRTVPTTVAYPEELFLREGQSNVVFPRIPNGISVNVTWVTSDGSTLSKGDSVGSYSVSILGQLLISRVSESHEGTYSVLLTNSLGEFIGLYVIRVIVYSTTSQEPTQTPITSTDFSSVSGTPSSESTTDFRQPTDTTPNRSSTTSSFETETPTLSTRSDATMLSSISNPVLSSTDTTRSSTEMTSSPTPTASIIPEELFFTEGQTNVIFPRIPNGINLNVSWVTAEGLTLSKGDIIGSYSVNNVGQLLISRVTEEHEGTYSVLLTDSFDQFVGLYVIRVVVYNATSQEPTQMTLTSFAMPSTNETPMSSAGQSSTDEIQTTFTPSVTSNSFETETATTIISSRPGSTSDAASSTHIPSTYATSSVSQGSTMLMDFTTREVESSTSGSTSSTLSTSDAISTTLTSEDITFPSSSLSISQTEPFSTTQESNGSPSGFPTDSTLNGISTSVELTRQSSTSNYLELTSLSTYSLMSTRSSQTSQNVLTTDEATTENESLITTDDASPETSSLASPSTTTDFLTSTTETSGNTAPNSSPISVRQQTMSQRTVSQGRTEGLPTTSASTSAGTEPRPDYIIPLSIGISLAGVAFILLFFSFCLVLAKSHREDYGLRIAEQERKQTGELISISDVDEESGGLGNLGSKGIEENGRSNPYSLEPERANDNASDSRIVSVVGPNGNGYDTIYYVDGSVQDANHKQTNNVFY